MRTANRKVVATFFAICVMLFPSIVQSKDIGIMTLVDCTEFGLSSDQQDVCQAVSECKAEGKTTGECWLKVQGTKLVAKILNSAREPPGITTDKTVDVIRFFPDGKFKIKPGESEWNRVVRKLDSITPFLRDRCNETNVTCKIVAYGSADGKRIRNTNQVTNEVAAQSSLARSRAEEVVRYLNGAGVEASMSAMGSWDKDNTDKDGKYRKVMLVVTVETYQPPKTQRPLVFINNQSVVKAKVTPPTVIPPFPIKLGFATRFWNTRYSGEWRDLFAEHSLFIELDWKLGWDWLHLNVPVYAGVIKMEGQDKAFWSFRTHPWVNYQSNKKNGWYFSVGAGPEASTMGNLNGPKHNTFGGGMWIGGGHKYLGILVGASGGVDYRKQEERVSKDGYGSIDVRVQFKFDQFGKW